MTYLELFRQIQAKRSFLCVGLDTDRAQIPLHLQQEPDALFIFNKAIIDATAAYTVAYKPNLAFYEAEGAHGWEQLSQTLAYIKAHYSDIFIIADAKRGDIGNTAQHYAKALFEQMDADAVTLSPYMGLDAIDPFLSYKGKWSIVLALTSNPSAVDFELQAMANGKPLYEEVILKSCARGSKEQLMFVVGATRPEKLAEIRRLVPEHFLLVPGVGTQGGTVAEVAKYGMNSHCGLLVNVSRGIIFADNSKDFAQVAGLKAKETMQEMDALLRTAGI